MDNGIERSWSVFWNNIDAFASRVGLWSHFWNNIDAFARGGVKGGIFPVGKNDVLMAGQLFGTI